MVNIYNMFSLLANKQLVESLPEGLLVFLPIMVMILFVWALVWKGFALWKSAKLNQKYWFIAMLVINTMGILEILYIFVFSRKSEPTAQSAPQQPNQTL